MTGLDLCPSLLQPCIPQEPAVPLLVSTSVLLLYALHFPQVVEQTLSGHDTSVKTDKSQHDNIGLKKIIYFITVVIK